MPTPRENSKNYSVTVPFRLDDPSSVLHKQIVISVLYWKPDSDTDQRKPWNDAQVRAQLLPIGNDGKPQFPLPAGYVIVGGTAQEKQSEPKIFRFIMGPCKPPPKPGKYQYGITMTQPMILGGVLNSATFEFPGPVWR